MGSRNSVKQIDNSKRHTVRSIDILRKRTIFVNNTARNFMKKPGYPTRHADANALNDKIDMHWYEAWLTEQLQNIPYSVRQLTVENQKLLVTPKVDIIHRLAKIIGNYAQRTEGVSIDEIASHLQLTGIFDKTEESLPAQRLLIFAILGWGSMLFQAGFNICSAQELAIHQDSNQPQSGLVFDTYRVPSYLCDRPLSILLKAFGNLLPARFAGVAQNASESSKMVSSWLPIYPTETNAYPSWVTQG